MKGNSMTPERVLDTDKQQVTAVIKHLVKPGSEPAYEQWLRQISQVARQFEGHAGVTFMRPQDSVCPEYVIVLKFDCYRYLQQWLDSPERQDCLSQAKPLIQRDEKVEVLTGLETWFTLPGKLVQTPPKRYKMACLTTGAVFIVVQLLSRLLAPVLSGLPPLLRALIVTALTVVLLTYVIMPRLTRLFYRWLYPQRG